ncbi:GTP-binding protein [Patiriisocius marinistellae]|uniref:GTP-binding protein n=1 Tax=Patiriisocius marinistellae TaxID=2494560 RepID=A0A5J4FSI8_9FLAO|nr:Rab family GTPase [Patiriisocius marinistellae]GEQ85077.1 GTP-binding protein [Patiriisocius marinistellae]
MAHPKKIVLLGHFGVGKTSLIRRFVESQFSEDYLVTVGVHVKKKEISIDGNNITLVIWDIEGNTSIDKARKSYLLGTSGFIYVFDISRPETFESLETEMKYLQDNFENVPVEIVGNKKDKFGEAVSEEFFKTQRFENCTFTSAKEGDNVEDAFEQLTRKMLAI